MKKFNLVLVILALLLSSTLTSCWTTSDARETVPKTAVTLQRVRSSFMSDTPMQVFVNDESYELANGASTTILVNNGEYVAHAVLGNQESRSIRFTANSRTIILNVSPDILFGVLVVGPYGLKIEVK